MSEHITQARFCVKCGADHTLAGTYNFCAGCGAPMRYIKWSQTDGHAIVIQCIPTQESKSPEAPPASQDSEIPPASQDSKSPRTPRTPRTQQCTRFCFPGAHDIRCQNRFNDIDSKTNADKVFGEADDVQRIYANKNRTTQLQDFLMFAMRVQNHMQAMTDSDNHPNLEYSDDQYLQYPNVKGEIDRIVGELARTFHGQ